MAEIRCPKCNFPNRASARFCAQCAAPLLSGLSESQAPSGSSDLGLMPGTILQGRYRIEQELGRGGFGAVYKAWDSNLSKLCALKENLETSAEAQRQFTREATVLANLTHPNLPRVTDHFIISGQGQYLVMDFVEGEDLVSLTNRQGRVEALQAGKWITQVAEALEYLHSRNPPVVHRDIKPSNIRVTPDGRAILVDFGLVKVSAPHSKTTLGARAVTPGFAPPEQYGQGSTDHRTDIYALGATLYALVTGQDPVESVQRLVGAVQPDAAQVNPAVSSALSQVIKRSMSVDPDQRFQSAGEFKVALQQALLPPSAVQRVAGAAPSAAEAPGSTVLVAPPAAPAYTPVARPAVAGTVVVGDHPVQTYPGPAEVPWSPAAPPRSSKRGVWMGVGAVVAIVACLGIGLLGLLAAINANQNEQATQTSQALSASQTAVNQAEATRSQQQTATAQASTHATATAQQATAQANQAPTAPPYGISLSTAKQWDLQVYDVFDVNENDWPTNSLFNDYSEAAWSITGGKYRWEANTNDGYSWWVCNDMVDVSRYYYGVDAFAIKGYDLADHGIIFNCSKPGDSYQFYLFLIRHPDQFGIFLYQDKNWTTLNTWTTSSALYTDRPNRLAVIADGNDFEFFINDQFVSSLAASYLSSGGIGMLISLNSYIESAIWEFDNLEVRTP